MNKRCNKKIIGFLFLILILSFGFFILSESFYISRSRLKEVNVNDLIYQRCNDLKYDWQTLVYYPNTKRILLRIVKRSDFLRGFKIQIFYDLNHTKNITLYNHSKFPLFIEYPVYFYIPLNSKENSFINKTIFKDLIIEPLVYINKTNKTYECLNVKIHLFYSDLIISS